MNEQSVFEYMVDNVENGQLKEGFSLANYDENLKAIGLADGENDMVARYNVDNIDERNLDGIINEIENAVVLISNGTFDEADRWFADLGKKYRIINIAHLIFEYVGENSEELYLDNIFQGAMYLITESKNPESIKAALIMLAMFQYDYKVKNIVRLLAQCEEFTYFAVRSMDEWDNGNLEIFQVAKKVNGWGRVYAIEMLEPSNIYIRDWVSREAMNLNVDINKISDDYVELINQIKNVNVPNKYMYCKVIPYGVEDGYHYIFPGDLIAIGDNVVIPFGADNELIVGKVDSYKMCTAEEAPYPVDSTKSIQRIIDNQEIVEEFPEIAKAEGMEMDIPADEHNHCGCGCGCEEHDHHGEHNHQEHNDHKNDSESKQAKVTSITGEDLDEDDYIKTPPEFFSDVADDDDEELEDEEMAEMVQNDIDDLVEHIQENDLEAILEWAILHHGDQHSTRIKVAVVDAYNYCIENGYDVETAALNLGSIYYTGITVPRDYVQAAKYYQMSADEGNVQAICNLGYCYYYGRHQAVDYKKAYGCFNMAAVLGSANALYKLGDMFLNGRYVERNPLIAYKLFQRAEDEAGPWEDISADIDLRLGRCYLRGLGVEKDLERAMEKLCSAYSGLYARRGTDPFVKGVLKTCRDLMTECEEELDEGFVERM